MTKEVTRTLSAPSHGSLRPCVEQAEKSVSCGGLRHQSGVHFYLAADAPPPPPPPARPHPQTHPHTHKHTQTKHTHTHTHTFTDTHTHTHSHTHTHLHKKHTLADRSSRGMPFARLHLFVLQYHLLWPILEITLHGIRWKQCTAKIATECRHRGPGSNPKNCRYVTERPH